MLSEQSAAGMVVLWKQNLKLNSAASAIVSAPKGKGTGSTESQDGAVDLKIPNMDMIRSDIPRTRGIA
ncbi:hypothetical protein [Bradyrhizobium sp. 153]|uniref:hypothetical protein n=1 Tax=Bradyrhizobium sp. 153 TaxID=2782627 RepID=UPI001FFBD903|nr:hypothetical protein [Bradyrhizobium sp. 153]MCK1668942.1 hypothetical protein [Bradyrhizobium sp. 153]